VVGCHIELVAEVARLAQSSMARATPSSSSSESTPPPPFSFPLSPTRFPVLALFCLGNFINEFCWNFFTPVYRETASVFNVSDAAVTLLPVAFLVVFPPAAILVSWVRGRYGMRGALVAGACVQAAGCWLRYAACAGVAPDRGRALFAVLLAGQALTALAQPVFTNLPAALAAVWFCPAGRPLATMLGAMANPVGNAFGALVPGLLVPPLGAGGAGAVEGARAALAWLTLGQAAAATVVALGVWRWLPEAPPSPPSAAAAMQRGWGREGGAGEGERRAGLEGGDSSGAKLLEGAGAAASGGAPPPTPWSELRSAFRALLCGAEHGSFRWLLGGFALGLGIANALLALLGQVLAPCGHGAGDAGLVGGALLGAGLLTAAGASAALSASRAYVGLLRLGMGGTLAGALGLLACLSPGVGLARLLPAAAAFGALAVPLQPLTLESAAELTFPLPADASAALLTAGGKLLGAALVGAMQPLLGRGPNGGCAGLAAPAAILVLACLAAAAGALAMVRPQYRRLAAEAGWEEGRAGGRQGGQPQGMSEEAHLREG